MKSWYNKAKNVQLHMACTRESLVPQHFCDLEGELEPY